MRFRLTLGFAVFLSLFLSTKQLSAQESCQDIESQLVQTVIDRFPCPTSPEKLVRFEKEIKNRIILLKNGFRLLNRGAKLDTSIDSDAILAELTNYAEQCLASISPPEDGGDVPDVPQSPDPPSGGLAEVCSQSSSIAEGEMLIKSEISKHIHNADPRATGYTLVCGSLCVSKLRRADFFYADGSYAGSVGYYGRFSGNGQPRLYGAAAGAPQHFASQIAAKADTIGNGMLYLQTSSASSGSETVCKEFNPRGRNGGL